MPSRAFSRPADGGLTERFETSGTARGFGSETVTDIWSSDWKGTLNQRFRMRDTNTGGVVRQDTFVGQGSTITSSTVPAADVFRPLLDQVMYALRQDEVLRGTLN